MKNDNIQSNKNAAEAKIMHKKGDLSSTPNCQFLNAGVGSSMQLDMTVIMFCISTILRF